MDSQTFENLCEGLKVKMEALAIKEANLVQAQERIDQAEQMAIAQKTIYEQKVQILELEENERNSAVEHLNFQNSSMLTTISDYQDLVERISNENRFEYKISLC